jgi:hypothetical protein
VFLAQYATFDHAMITVLDAIGAPKSDVELGRKFGQNAARKVAKARAMMVLCMQVNHQSSLVCHLIKTYSDANIVHPV